MTSARIHVAGEGRSAAKVEEIAINGSTAGYQLRTDHISERLQRPIPDQVCDLLDIAASVAAADSLVSRGTSARAHMGAHWSRQISIDLDLRDPSFWSQPTVRNALQYCLTNMTDDRFDLRFAKGDAPNPTNDYLPFDHTSDPGGPINDVILFSGGLDSYAGALKVLSEGDGRVALVSHRGATKTARHQLALAKRLKARFPNRVLHIQVEAHLKGMTARETTQRSRSFVFAALAHAAARGLGAKRILIFENGVVSQNLPISPQVVGTMASRTTHPLVIRNLQSLLDLLDPIPIETPFVWKTRAEVLSIIARHDGQDGIRDSVSCTTVRAQSSKHSHCGQCSQCLGRRFAIMAAGLQAFDPAENYAVDVLTGAQDGSQHQILALEWTRHALEIDKMDLPTFYTRYSNALTRIAEGFPTLELRDVYARSFDMQKRHATAVRQVLQASVAEYAQAFVDATLPDSSLLAMVVQNGQPPLVAMPQIKRDSSINSDETDEQEALSVEGTDPARGFDPKRLRVRFSATDASPWLEVINLGRVTGKKINVARQLAKHHRKDVLACLDPINHSFVSSGELAQHFGKPKNIIRSEVRRVRHDLAAHYKVLYNQEPPNVLLIHTDTNLGYRIDPWCRIIDDI